MASNNFYSVPPPPPPPPRAGYEQTQPTNTANTGAFYSGQATSGGVSNDDWFTPTPTPAAPTAYVPQPAAPAYAPSVGMNSNGSGEWNAAPAAYSQPQVAPQPQTAAPTPAAAPSQYLSGPMSGSVGGSMGMSGTMAPTTSVAGNDDYENEPPLLEELGIHIPQIIAKTKAVIIPFGKNLDIEPHILESNDLAGPLTFCLALGGELVLTGKLHFEYIYGFALFGCFGMSLVLNLMSPKVDAISPWRVTSILGYSLLPVNVLAAFNVFIRIAKCGTIGFILAGICIAWCTIASTRLFERSCEMRDQRYLIAYPSILLYTSFVIITIF